MEPMVKANIDIARSILKRYMADYTTTATAPKSIKAGFYAITMEDTGEVWLSETSNFQSCIRAFRMGSNTAHCIKEARARGTTFRLYLLTQPQRFSAQACENELYEANLLAARKVRVTDGEGKLYVIRHRVSLDYFVHASRRDLSDDTVLNSFINYLQHVPAHSQNAALAEFATTYAGDILNGMNFDIMLLDKFTDREDEWLRRQLYVDNCKTGKCLNFKSME